MGARLVRHRLGDIPWKNEEGKQQLRTSTDPVELNQLLLQKLLEETGEFVAAAEFSEQATELADVLEAGISRLVISAAYQISRQDAIDYVLNRLDDKYRTRGGFLQGLIWEV